MLGGIVENYTVSFDSFTYAEAVAQTKEAIKAEYFTTAPALSAEVVESEDDNAALVTDKGIAAEVVDISLTIPVDKGGGSSAANTNNKATISGGGSSADINVMIKDSKATVEASTTEQIALVTPPIGTNPGWRGNSCKNWGRFFFLFPLN